MFATEHDFDAATQLFMKSGGAAAWRTGHHGDADLDAREIRPTDVAWAGPATKDALANVLRGNEHGTPALLFSGSHGWSSRLEDARQRTSQGAIVCQDWDGFGAINEQHWFAAPTCPPTRGCTE